MIPSFVYSIVNYTILIFLLNKTHLKNHEDAVRLVDKALTDKYVTTGYLMKIKSYKEFFPTYLRNSFDCLLPIRYYAVHYG